MSLEVSAGAFVQQCKLWIGMPRLLSVCFMTAECGSHLLLIRCKHWYQSQSDSNSRIASQLSAHVRLNLQLAVLKRCPKNHVSVYCLTHAHTNTRIRCHETALDCQFCREAEDGESSMIMKSECIRRGEGYSKGLVRVGFPPVCVCIRVRLFLCLREKETHR